MQTLAAPAAATVPSAKAVEENRGLSGVPVFGGKRSFATHGYFPDPADNKRSRMLGEPRPVLVKCVSGEAKRFSG